MRIAEELGLPLVNGDIGIEIEMEGTNLNLGSMNYWRATSDGSLRGESVEWVNKGPIEKTNIDKVLQYLASRLEKNYSVLNPSKRCGTHIHVNCQQLTSIQVINFISIYLIVEDVLVRSFGDAREGNMFCLRCKDADYLINNLLQCIRMGSLRYLQPEMRYSAINPAAINKYGSLEFRSMPSPKDLALISNWAHMFLRMRDAAEMFNNTKDIVEGISNQGQIPFLETIFGKYFPLVTCDNMEDMVIDGCRRVQTIAYEQWPTKKTVVKTQTLQQMENGFFRGEPVVIPTPPDNWMFTTTTNGI